MKIRFVPPLEMQHLRAFSSCLVAMVLQSKLPQVNTQELFLGSHTGSYSLTTSVPLSCTNSLQRVAYLNNFAKELRILNDTQFKRFLSISAGL